MLLLLLLLLQLEGMLSYMKRTESGGGGTLSIAPS